MWKYALLDALFDVVYRFLDLLGILWSILTIPFSCLFAGYTLNFKDCIAYCKFIIHSRFNRLRTFNFTITLAMDAHAPRVIFHDYNENTQEASDRINKTKFTSIRACITQTLLVARRYSFVVFQVNESASRFIQLRTDTGIYLFDFSLTPLTLNRDYAIDLIKLLCAKGFTKTDPAAIYRKKSYCIDQINPELTAIQANLGSDVQETAAFCSMVLTKILKMHAIPEVMIG